MKVYRIEREQYLSSTLKGIGAAKSLDFRWNSPGTPMVYTSESAALATLEVSAHLDLSQDLPTDRYYIEIIIPDSIPILQMDIKEFPKGWDDRPPSLISQAIGDIFIKEGEFPVFRVPSAIVPLEFNYLINPLHPFSKVIKVVNTNPMVFDPRFQNTKASK